MSEETIIIGVVVFVIIFLAFMPKRQETEQERMMREAETAKRMASLSAETKAKIKALIAQNNLIEAIKLFRTETGAGLKESKDAVEAIQREEKSKQM